MEYQDSSIQIGLSVNHTPEYVRGRGPLQEECSSHEQCGGEKIKGDNHMMAVGCGKPESFLLAWVQDAA